TATSRSCSSDGALIVLSDIVGLLRKEGLSSSSSLVTPPGQVARALRPAVLGVTASGGHRKIVADAIGALLAFARDRHFALNDEESRVEFMGVLRVGGVRLHLAIDNLVIAVGAALGLELRPVHRLSPQMRYRVWRIVACAEAGRGVNSL